MNMIKNLFNNNNICNNNNIKLLKCSKNNPQNNNNNLCNNIMETQMKININKFKM